MTNHEKKPILNEAISETIVSFFAGFFIGLLVF